MACKKRQNPLRYSLYNIKPFRTVIDIAREEENSSNRKLDTDYLSSVGLQNCLHSRDSLSDEIDAALIKATPKKLGILFQLFLSMYYLSVQLR